MRIAICKAYAQDFYIDAPADVNEGDVIYVQIAKDKKTAAEVVAVGEYRDDDNLVKILLKGRPKKKVVGKITLFGGEHE